PGVLLRMAVEIGQGDPDTAEGVQRSLARGLPDLTRYLEHQMAAGRLRRMHPVLALQLLAGPVVAHLLTRPLAALVGFAPPPEEVADQIARAWLRAMAPEPAGDRGAVSTAGGGQGTAASRTESTPHRKPSGEPA